MHVFVIHLPVHAYSKAVMPENDFFGVNLFHFPSLDCSSFFYNRPCLSSLARSQISQQCQVLETGFNIPEQP